MIQFYLMVEFRLSWPPKHTSGRRLPMMRLQAHTNSGEISKIRGQRLGIAGCAKAPCILMRNVGQALNRRVLDLEVIYEHLKRNKVYAGIRMAQELQTPESCCLNPLS